MAEASSQTNRRWLWAGTVVVLLAVFFTARYFLRERLPVRVAQVEHAMLVNTISTNGRVEPVVNYQFYSPIATTVKAVYAQEGDKVPAGKLLVTLDDVAARAQVASAESAVRTAQANSRRSDAQWHPGRTASFRRGDRSRIDSRVDQAQHDLDALNKLAATGAAAPSEVAAARDAAGFGPGQPERSPAKRAPSLLARRCGARPGRTGRCRSRSGRRAAHRSRRPKFAPLSREPSTAWTLLRRSSLRPATCFSRLPTCSHERVRGYFDEPDLGRLAVGQAVVIRWDAKPGMEWHGHVVRLPSAVVTYTTRNVGEVLIDFDGSSDGLLPDTNVTLTVTTSSMPDTLSMPREALHEQNGKYFVFKVVNDELKRVPVTIGAPNLTQVPILSGLEEGDVVAIGTTNGQPLQEGVPIKEQQ